MNLPWTADYIEIANVSRPPEYAGHAFPWLVLDCWGVVIARFDREEQAKAAVAAVNSVAVVS